MKQIPDEIKAYLKRQKSLSLATIDQDSGVYSCPLYYIFHEPNKLIFQSSNSSRHCKNILIQAKISGSIQADHTSFIGIEGIQFVGVCTTISKAEEQFILDLYCERFSEIKANLMMLNKLKKNQFYQTDIDWIKYTNNKISFGYKLEWEKFS